MHFKNKFVVKTTQLFFQKSFMEPNFYGTKFFMTLELRFSRGFPVSTKSVFQRSLKRL